MLLPVTVACIRILRGKTFLHVLPTLVNLQWDDQPYGACNLVVITRPEQTVLTWVSRTFRNSSMRARPHKCLWRTFFWIRTTSPRRSWKIFPTGLESRGNFSVPTDTFVHRFQKSSDSFCFNRSSLARLCLALGSGPVGIVISLSPIKKCAGVSAAESSPCVMGLVLTAASVLIKAVFSCSPVSLDCPILFADNVSHCSPSSSTILPTKPLATR